MTIATLATISIAALVAGLILLNLAYRSYLGSLTPREREEDDDETTDFLQKW